MENRTTSFKTGPGEEDEVAVETLLQKLALAESVIKSMAGFIERVIENDGTLPDDLEAPDDWAISGMYQNICNVQHALKCGCWGYKAAILH